MSLGTGTGTPAASEIQDVELFRQIVENIDQVCWVADVHTKKLLYVGPAYEELWGRGSKSCYLDREWAVETVHSEDRERLLSFVEKEVLEPVEDFYRVIRPDGSVRLLHFRWFPVRDSQGKVYRSVGLARDITAQREVEEELRQARKMEALEGMAGGLVHHFNNLLTIISGYSYLLLKTEAEDHRREELSRISNASSHAARITEQLLAFSGHQFIQPRLVSINHLLADMVSRLFGVLGADITIETTFRPDVGYIKVDPDQLNRAVVELAGNAREAMPNGGRFRIETEMAEVAGAQTEKRVGGPGRCVQLRISDTGCGMGRHTRERAFEPFFTTKGLGKGMGLGLSMVYGIIRQNEGSIHLQSEPGQGTVFRLCFPSVKEAEAEPAARVPGRDRSISQSPE
jgi:PAS domain S-box-containing protein